MPSRRRCDAHSDQAVTRVEWGPTRQLAHRDRIQHVGDRDKEDRVGRALRNAAATIAGSRTRGFKSSSGRAGLTEGRTASALVTAWRVEAWKMAGRPLHAGDRWVGAGEQRGAGSRSGTLPTPPQPWARTATSADPAPRSRSRRAAPTRPPRGWRTRRSPAPCRSSPSPCPPGRSAARAPAARPRSRPPAARARAAPARAGPGRAPGRTSPQPSPASARGRPCAATALP